jgi:hypothetical protein
MAKSPVVGWGKKHMGAEAHKSTWCHTVTQSKKSDSKEEKIKCWKDCLSPGSDILRKDDALCVAFLGLDRDHELASISWLIWLLR